MKRLAVVLAVYASLLAPIAAQPANCSGLALNNIRGLAKGKMLQDGSILGFSKMNINIDGYGKAYHPRNAAAGALLHLCNAGKVHLPDGTSYHGSVDNPTCVGRFMRDFAQIGAAGWKDPGVGSINWYGILGGEEARIAGRTVKNVVPVSQSDGSGFYVSPTAFHDEGVTDTADQSRYVNPLRIPAGVIPNQASLKERGVVLGSFGVAFDPTKRIAVPFVVGDIGPRVGEGTPALARSIAGLPITDDVNRTNRFAGAVSESRVLWVFFGENIPPVRYDSRKEQSLVSSAKTAFEQWGGMPRLQACQG